MPNAASVSGSAMAAATHKVKTMVACPRIQADRAMLAMRVIGISPAGVAKAAGHAKSLAPLGPRFRDHRHDPDQDIVFPWSRLDSTGRSAANSALVATKPSGT
jgi:hypothetical protein